MNYHFKELARNFSINTFQNLVELINFISIFQNKSQLANIIERMWAELL